MRPPPRDGLRRRAAALAAVAATTLLLTAAPASAGVVSQRFCGQPGAALGAAEHDRLLRLADAVKRELEASGATVALIARSGLNLARFGIRYSHAGLALRTGEAGPWSVRQLYYDCDHSEPRLFDQGMAGFVLGNDDPALGYISLLLLPAEAAAPLEAAVRDSERAWRFVAGRYSANAYPFSLRYQNCNQWLAELMAAAWSTEPIESRADAQRWLAAQRYAPARVELGVLSWPLWRTAAAFVPWLHFDDQPDHEGTARHVLTSLPTSLEAFVQARWPAARRIELCQDGRRVVVRAGGAPIEAACRAREGDHVLALDDGPARVAPASAAR